jgi:hypothetical protein
MIQSDHPAGKRMRRRRGGANRLINCRRDPPAKVLAARISMSHLVPLLEFNHSSSTSLDWSVAERSAAGFPYVASNNPCRRGRRNAFGQKSLSGTPLDASTYPESKETYHRTSKRVYPIADAWSSHLDNDSGNRNKKTAGIQSTEF